MAVKSKTQLATDISTNIGATYNQTALQTVLDDMVDSYEDIFSQLTTVQRDAIVTPATGLIIYNTNNNRYEYWNGSAWFGIGQNISSPLTIILNLSSADILAIDATPITVATAPGVGFALLPIGMAWRFTYGSVQYTDGGGSNAIVLKCSTKSNSNAFGSVAQASIKAAANSSGNASLISGSSIDAIVENDDLVLTCNNPYSAGDGTLTIWLTYSIIPY